MGEYVAAVRVNAIDSTALRTDIRERKVDECHQRSTECAGDNRAVGEIPWIGQPQTLDRID